MEGHLVMSEKERGRKSVFDRVSAGNMKLTEASRMLSLSYRHVRRSYKRFREEGDAGLLHRSRGRPSNRARPAEFREEVIVRYKEKYDGFGPTLASEKLCEDGYEVDHETLRRWLMVDGTWKRRRKHAKHRSRRERKRHFGELVQLDGSHHRWFGVDGPQTCLMNMVDDATGATMALMAGEETTEAAMHLLRSWIKRYGIPKTLYTDKKNVFVTERERTLEEQLADKEPVTAFGAACKKLGIGIITANSPQAKGRVERSHGTYQDRFTKELALGGVTTIEGANELLGGGFLDVLNEKFARDPAEPVDYHRPVPGGMKLEEVLSTEETRVLANDWTIRHSNVFYQILKGNRPQPKPKDKVLVRTLLDGTIQIVFRDNKLKYKCIVQRPKKVVTKRPRVGKTRTWKPAPDHPWRRDSRTRYAARAK